MDAKSLPPSSLSDFGALPAWVERKIANWIFASLNIEMCLFFVPKRDLHWLERRCYCICICWAIVGTWKEGEEGRQQTQSKKNAQEATELAFFLLFCCGGGRDSGAIARAQQKKSKKVSSVWEVRFCTLPLFPGKKGLWHGGVAPLSAPQYPPLFSTKPIFWNFLPQGFFSYGTHAAYAFGLISIMLSLLPIPLLQPRL